MAKSGNVEVCIRVRPLKNVAGETGEAAEAAWELSANTITEKPKHPSAGEGRKYNFERVYGPSSTTREAYEKSVKENIIPNVLNGYNGTVFAYGQTGAGKTHTMLGSGGQTADGITPMALNDLYDGLEKAKQEAKAKGNELDVKVFIEAVEVYNETLIDLMPVPGKEPTLTIRENDQGVYVHNLNKMQVGSAKACMDQLWKAVNSRHVAATSMNDKSSRSHCVIRVLVWKEETLHGVSDDEDEDDGMGFSEKKKNTRLTTAYLNLVDLAGSERVAKTGATGADLVSGANINKSLSALLGVINALAEPPKKKPGQSGEGTRFVPYRDSKLTYLLKTALGGNSLCTVFCCMHPSRAQEEESKSTLQFASQAKKIKNVIKQNEVMNDGARIRALQQELKESKEMNAVLRLYCWSKDLKIKKLQEGGGGGGEMSADAVAEQEAQEEMINQLEQDNMRLLSELEELRQNPGGGGHVDPSSLAGGDREEIQRLTAEMKDMQEVLEGLEKDNEGLVQTTADYEEVISELEAEAEAKESLVNDLEETVKELEKEMQKMQSEMDSTQSQLDHLQAQKREDESRRLEAARGNELLEQLTQLRIDHDRLEMEHNTVVEELAKAEIERETVNQIAEDQKNEMNAKITGLKQDIALANSHIWRFINLSHLANGTKKDESAVEGGGSKLTSTVKTSLVDSAVKSLLLFISSRQNKAPNVVSSVNQQDTMDSALLGVGASPVSKKDTTAAAPLPPASPTSSGGSSSANSAQIKELEKKVAQYEETIRIKDAKRDVIIDTKLKRMQELVLRLHTSNHMLTEDVSKLAKENNALHDIIRKESKLAKAAKAQGMEPVNESLLKNRALYTEVPSPPHYHN